MNKPEPEAENGHHIFYGYIITEASFCIILVGMGFFNSFGVFLKPMITDFGWSRALISGVYSFSNIVRGLMGILMGGLNDRFGPRIVLTLCGFLLGLGFLLTSQINSVWQLYLIYIALIGLGTSGIVVPLSSTVTKWFTKRRSLMTGIVLSGADTGILIGPLVVGWLISISDWRMSYIVVGITAFFIVVGAAQFLKHDPSRIGQVPYGESEAAVKAFTSWGDKLSLKNALATNQFWLIAFISFAQGFIRLIIIVHLVPHITDLGYSTVSSANFLAVIGATSLLGSITGGALADRLGSRKAFIISFFLMAASVLWLVEAQEIWGLYLFSVIFGLGNGSGTPLRPPLLANMFGLGAHGRIFGATNALYTLGASVGPLLAGYIFDVESNYRLAFLTIVAVGIAGIILTLMLTPLKKPVLGEIPPSKRL